MAADDHVGLPARVVRRGRRGVLGLSWLLAGCIGNSAAAGRRFLVLELVREARVPGERASISVSACRWHVSRDGALYGDHWGWCEDFKVLPDSSPGYLLLTTLFSGGATGGFGRLVVLPASGAEVQAFGRRVRAEAAGGSVRLEFGGAAATLRQSERAALGVERGLVEPSEDTGHFEPGYAQPLEAELTFSAIHHGWLDQRRIAGRAAP